METVNSYGDSSNPASCTSHRDVGGGLYFGQRRPDHQAFPVDAATHKITGLQDYKNIYLPVTLEFVLQNA